MGVRMVEADRGRKVPLYRRTLRPTKSWLRRSRTAKVGQLNKRRQTQARARKSLACPTGKESTNERWRPTGGGTVRVDGRSAPGQYGEGEAGAKRYRSGIDG